MRGEEIKIPCRVYFEEPEGKKLADLNRRQQTILHCIYLRHHNGFVRERHLTKIIEADDYFALPFQVLILGEYVEELISILDQGISDQNIS